MEKCLKNTDVDLQIYLLICIACKPVFFE